MKNVIQKISYQIKPYSEMNKKTGKHPFGLQIVIDGDPRMISISLKWFRCDFDPTKEQFNLEEPNVALLRDYNLLIAKEKAKANDIITRYRLSDRKLTHKWFKWEFNNSESKENVHTWLTKRADTLVNNGEVTNASRKTYTTKFARFKNFYPGILPFSSIDSGLIIKFDNYLRNNFAYNTVVGTHKTMRKFFSLAVKEGLIHETPYNDKIKNSYNEGERECLEPFELTKLINLFQDKSKLTDSQLNVLEMYVFAATSGGYRFSELQILEDKHIRFGTLRLNTVKGAETGVSLKIELPEIGLRIVEGRKGKIFKSVAEPTANKHLKELASMAGIKKHLVFHSARDTFGTLYVYFGGDITTLSKDIFKHSKLETTMIYQKKSSEMKRRDMQNFNRFSLPSFGSDNIKFDDAR